MTIKEAREILSQYDTKELLRYELEDCSFGDGSHSIHLSTAWDSKREAKEVAEAIKIIITTALH